MEKIVIKSVDRPAERNPDDMIRWFCEALGLTNSAEKDSLEAEILKRFIIAAAHNVGISSSQIKLKPKVARSTVVYHLNRFIDAGIVVKRGRLYYLRGQELSSVIEELEYDINREMMRLMDVARDFDRMFDTYHKKGKEVKIE